MHLVFRKKNPKREHGNEIVPWYEYTKGKIVWVSNTEDPMAERREYVCTGNGTEVVPMEDFHIIMDEEKAAASRRRKEPLYSRTADLAKEVPEERKPSNEVVPLPETAIGATA